MSLELNGWKRSLEARLGPERIQESVPLAPFTTFRIGGPADLFFRATTPWEMVEACRTAREEGIPAFVLGTGANILVADAGFRGLVIRCEVGGVERVGPEEVVAGAGVQVFPDLIRATVGWGLGGLHHFVGIPSTVGGAMWQNLHFLSPAPERERMVFIQEVVDSAEILTEEGALQRVGVEYFRFGYDTSILHERGDVVLSVTFRLASEPTEELQRVMRENLAWRDERHPDLWLYPSAGSVFKKVREIGAGRLIDQCGLKGRVHGGAEIFHRHANIIVNLGWATASDVLALMELARETVLRETGYELESEILLVGEM